MRSIIACTDFSKNATHAVEYAAALAAALKARLVLFNHYDYYPPATDLPAAVTAFYVDEIEESAEHSLKALKETLQQKYPVEITYAVRSFDIYDDLEEMFEREHANLIVMGMQGKNLTANILFGSLAAKAIRKGRLPLLLVKEGQVFKPVKKILFAYDRQALDNTAVLEPLRLLAKAFDAYVEVFSLAPAYELESVEVHNSTQSAAVKLEAQLSDVRHYYAQGQDDDVTEGILEETILSYSGLVAMIPRHHSFLSTLINRSDTHRVALATEAPLLVLGEKTQV